MSRAIPLRTSLHLVVQNGERLYHFGFWILDFGLGNSLVHEIYVSLSVAFFFQIGIKGRKKD